MTRRRRPYRMNGQTLFRALREDACQRQKGLCHWCGVVMRRDVPPNHPQSLTGDHLTPRYAGGKTQHGNIVAACFECNSSRNSVETNHQPKGAATVSVGDDESRSPFEKLAALLT